MRWLRLAARNLAGRRLRNGVAVAGVAIAIGALFSLVSCQRGYQSGLHTELDRLGAHVLVVPKGCPYNAASIALHGASWPCYLKESYTDRVRKAPGVAVAAPVFMNAVYDKGDSAWVYLGVREDIAGIKRAWRVDGAMPRLPQDCLVGAAVARKLHLQKGSSFPLPGIEHANGTVCGVLQAGAGEDDGFIYMPLAAAQKLFHRPGQITHILVRLSDPAMLDQVVANLRSCEAGLDMNIVPLTHLFRSIQSLVGSTRLLLGCVALIALLAAAAGVSNTILMAVTERTREIGLMRAVGASASDVFRLILLETVLICLAGGTAGLAGSLVTGKMLENWMRAQLAFTPDGRLFAPSLLIAAACLSAAAALGSLAGLLPAWRAARLSPIAAIRTGASV